ncbi:MAG: hypothetical protein AABZ06_12300 [Bdellovibrionota bacterium]
MPRLNLKQQDGLAWIVVLYIIAIILLVAIAVMLIKQGCGGPDSGQLAMDFPCYGANGIPISNKSLAKKCCKNNSAIIPPPNGCPIPLVTMQQDGLDKGAAKMSAAGDMLSNASQLSGNAPAAPLGDNSKSAAAIGDGSSNIANSKDNGQFIGDIKAPQKAPDSGAGGVSSGDSGNLTMSGAETSAATAPVASPTATIEDSGSAYSSRGGKQQAKTTEGDGGPLLVEGLLDNNQSDGESTEASFGSSDQDVLKINDPVDYFTRIDPDENIFHLIEKRYRHKTTEWMQGGWLPR